MPRRKKNVRRRIVTRRRRVPTKQRLAAARLCENARAAVLSARSSKTRAKAMKDYRKFYMKATGRKPAKMMAAKKKANQLKGGFGSAARYVKMRELAALLPLPTQP